MTRKEELLKLVDKLSDDNKIIARNIVDEILFLESQLVELKKLPMIKVHPKNPEIIKQTTASKVYKEFLSQYNNTIKNLSSMIGKVESNEESPLRAYLKALNK